MRLAAEVKLGYYPTPQPIADRLAQAFIPPTEGRPATALDPFCGTGAALAAFPASFTAGSDLDAERLEEAAMRLTETLQADAWALKPRAHSTSLLLLNPPYMEDPVSRERQEIRAVHTFTPWLHRAGYLVLIAPRRVVLNARYLLDRVLTLCACWRFPDPDYAAFAQIIVVAQPRQSSDPPNDWSAWLSRERPPAAPPSDDTWADRRDPAWPRPLPEILTPTWPLPATPGFHLAASRPRRDQLLPLLAHSAAWETLKSQTAPRETLDLKTPIHTPLTLHRGHLATLLTAGKLTGAIGRGDQRHLVRGRTLPYTVVTAETEDQRVEETRYRIEITTVHPDGTVRAWHETTETASMEEEVLS